MATTVQIKRSTGVAAPTTSTLLEAELAYSQDKTNDGAGAILYIESVDSGSSAVIHKVGGKYYTDIVDGATNANTASKLVKRDASGNFAANIITATLYGQANTAVTANTLTTARSINLTGNVTGTASFNGSANADITVALENTGVTATTYGGTSAIPVITVDAKGRVTYAANASITTSQNTFSTFAVAGQSDIVADSTTDTVTFASGTGVSLTTNAGSDTLTITNSGVTSTTAGTGISVSGATGGVTITNTGVTSAAAGVGVAVDTSTGTVTFTNTGVRKVSTSGAGLVADANTGNITLTNTGVTGLAGTTNEIEVSAASGNVTIGLPDNVTIGNDLTVSGNLYVQGVATTLNTAVVTVEDPLVRFGNANPADSLDIGFFGTYTNSGVKYAGLFRDASDSGKFKLFTGLQADPDTTPDVVNVNGTGYTVATLVANLTGGTVSGLSANIAVADGGTGRGTITTNAVLYGQGTSAVGLATGSAGQVLQLDGSGVPVFGGIDGGTY